MTRAKRRAIPRVQTAETAAMNSVETAAMDVAMTAAANMIRAGALEMKAVVLKIDGIAAEMTAAMRAERSLKISCRLQRTTLLRRDSSQRKIALRFPKKSVSRKNRLRRSGKRLPPAAECRFHVFSFPRMSHLLSCACRAFALIHQVRESTRSSSSRIRLR